MRTTRETFLIAGIMTAATLTSAAAQEPAAAVSCRDRPCALVVDWSKTDGIGSLSPDRRYGNPAELEARVIQALKERGFVRLGSVDSNDLRILLQPVIRNAMCDELPGTATDMSCKAITEIQTRPEGPDAVREGIDLPSRIRNRCGADRIAAVDKFAVHVAEYIIYAVEGKAKGERRPVARC
jgi:hypothetical protein